MNCREKILSEDYMSILLDYVPEEADRAPSGIWDISRPLSLRMRHRKKRRRIPKEMRRPEAFRGTLGSEDGAALRQKVPGEETVLDALPE